MRRQANPCCSTSAPSNATGAGRCCPLPSLTARSRGVQSRTLRTLCFLADTLRDNFLAKLGILGQYVRVQRHVVCAALVAPGKSGVPHLEDWHQQLVSPAAPKKRISSASRAKSQPPSSTSFSPVLIRSHSGPSSANTLSLAFGQAFKVCLQARTGGSQ